MLNVRISALLTLGLVGLAACGSSSTSGTPASANGSQAPTTQQSSGSSTPKIAVTACSLLSPTQLADLLGGTPVDPAGTEFDHGDNYKTCTWNSTTSAAQANASHINLGILRNASSSDAGFHHGGDFGTPEAVLSLGDSANYATRGQSDVELIVNKALWSLSLDSSAAAGSASIKAKMVDVARQILSQLGLA